MERDSGSEPCAKTLAGRTLQMKLNRIGRQAFGSETARHFSGEHRADGAVHIANRKMNLDRLAMLERVLGELDDLIVERLVEPVILQLDAMQRFVGSDIGSAKNIREVDIARLPMRDRFVAVEAFDVADQLGNRA